MPEEKKNPQAGFVRPILFEDAIDRLAARKPVGSPLDTAGWQAASADIRHRSIWSAGVTNAKFVQTFQDLLGDFLKKTVVALPNGKRAIKVGGREEFIRQMQDFVEREGIPRTGTKGTMQDIGSSTRLRLIFNVGISSAEQFGYWKQGQRAEILDAFPFWRFIRVHAVKVPRPLHEANVGVVRRKDDVPFWLAMNSPSIGGFGVPHGPWGFNSGCSTEDVARDHPDARGLLKSDEQVTPPAVAYQQFINGEPVNFNTKVESTTTGLSQEMQDILEETFPTLVEIGGGKITLKQ